MLALQSLSVSWDKTFLEIRECTKLSKKFLGDSQIPHHLLESDVRMLQLFRQLQRVLIVHVVVPAAMHQQEPSSAQGFSVKRQVGALVAQRVGLRRAHVALRVDRVWRGYKMLYVVRV